jgi:hypothetical protein
MDYPLFKFSKELFDMTCFIYNDLISKNKE